MLAFYGSRISEHMTTTPEGYLVCHHVPIARTGRQDYLAHEMGLEGDTMIKVFRLPVDVFSEAAIASFEGKPVTEGHPPVNVTPTNVNAYAKGHIQNIRRGAGDEDDLVIADMFITDPCLIDRVQSGMREVSCGYECDYVQCEDGYEQKAIRGNHVAVVEAGRAGDRVSIRDSSMPITSRQNERRTNVSLKTGNKKTNILGRLFGITAKDADPAEVAEVAAALTEAIEETQTDSEAAPPATPTNSDKSKDESPIDVTVLTEQLGAVLERLKGIEEKIERMHPADSTADPLDELLEETKKDEEGASPAKPADEDPASHLADEESVAATRTDSESETISQDEESAESSGTASKDAVAAAIAAIKPVLAKLPDKQRRMASDEAAKALRKVLGLRTDSRNGTVYAQIHQSRSTAQFSGRAADAASDPKQIGRDIMKARNPHYKG